MKRIILTLSLFVFIVFRSTAQYTDVDQYCGGSGPSVCTPVLIDSPGFSPSYIGLAPIIVGVPTAATLHYKNFNTVQQGTIPLTIDSLKIDTISNLPAGLCWQTNNVNNTFPNQGLGCIQITGTTNAAPGQYKLNIYIIAYTNIGSFGTYATAVGLNYYLRLNCSDTSAIVPVDTSGQATGTDIPFIAYNASNCTGGIVYQVKLGSNQTVCSGSNIILDPVVSGGQSPYSYAWSANGNSLTCPVCTDPSVIITQNSSYAVTVTDGANHTVTASVNYTVSGSGSLPQFSESNTNFACNVSYDTTTLNISGGSSPYTILWGDGSAADNSHAYNHTYSNGGLYVVEVQDANGCVNSALDSVNYLGVTLTLSQAVPPSCPATGNGSLVITASGGSAPYLYNWSNGANTNANTNIQAGSYLITVTDVNQCSAYYNYYLPAQHDEFYYVYASGTDANCSNNGAITTQIYGGVGNIAYNWSNGSTVANVTGLAGGNYTVTITDSLGCSTSGAAYVGTSCFSVISGYLFIDSNNNCIFDNNESGYSYMYVMATNNNGQYYGYTDNTGFYSIQVYGSGTYTLRADNYYWGGGQACDNTTLCGNGSSTVTIATNGDTSANNNFGISSSSGFDLTIHPGWTSANPGFEKEYWVMPFSQSALPFTGQATVVFTYDSNLVYNSSYAPIPAHNAAAHTLTWTVNSVPYPFYDWSNVRFENFFTVPATLPLGYLLQSDFLITPTTGDCDSSNNHMHFSEIVTGSHDPNEKTVEPADNIALDDSVLTYTIHFQNTGTDSTNFIIITDTLSSNLNPASVRNLASSAPYSKFAISGNGILTWTFNPMRLVDSITNPAGSKGFISFQVTKKANLPVGATISNTAYVYFDYNTAVITNTVTDTVSRPTYIFEVPAASSVSVKAFPNPFSGLTNIVVTGLNQKFDFEMYDVTGRLCRKISSIQTNQFEVNRNELSAGVYMYRIVTGNQQIAYGKLVVQ